MLNESTLQKRLLNVCKQNKYLIRLLATKSVNKLKNKLPIHYLNSIIICKILFYTGSMF